MGYGSTGASTALLQYELDSHLTDLAERIGHLPAQRCYRLCAEAVQGIERLADEVGGDVGLPPQAQPLSRHRPAGREGAGARAPGPAGDRARGRAALAQRHPRALLLRAAGARCSPPLAGEIDPLRFTHALLAAAASDGLEAYDRTGVARYQSDRKGVLLETADGWRVRARKAIFATGYNIPPFLPRKQVHLTSTFAFATSPLTAFDGWGEDQCLIWETARPYFYARTTPDGRAIMGGADMPFKGSHKVEKVQDRQTERLAAAVRRAVSPDPFDVDWSWSGTFAETADGLPYIGVPPEFPNGYVALGYGANGIRLRLHGRRHPGGSLPRPRKPGRGAVPDRPLGTRCSWPTGRFVRGRRRLG